MKNIKNGIICANIGFELHKESVGQLPKHLQINNELVKASTNINDIRIMCFTLFSKMGLKSKL